MVDFLEWIYRHFFHDEWLAWVRETCETKFAAIHGDEKNPLNRILEAFNQGQIDVLRKHQNDVQRLKDLLRQAKEQMFPLRVSTEDRELIAYP